MAATTRRLFVMHTPQNIIEISSVYKTYSGSDKPAVDGITLSVRKGCFFGLLGPNGAGKTTMISILCTLLRPDSGDVFISGVSIKDGMAKIKGMIGYVPQDIALYPTLTARENFLFFGKMQGLRGAYLKERVDRCLDIANMKNLAENRVETFSGGLKRRLSLAVGLIHNPRILFLDEPTVGIDPQSRHFIYESLKHMNADGMTIVYTSHYMEEVEYLCEEIAIMDRGKIISAGKVEELLARQGKGVLKIKTDAHISEAVENQIRALPGVRLVEYNDKTLTLISSSPTKTIVDVITLCERQGIGILSLAHGAANLEQLFMSLTGTILRD